MFFIFLEGAFRFAGHPRFLYIHQNSISMNRQTSIDLKKAMEKKHQ